MSTNTKKTLPQEIKTEKNKNFKEAEQEAEEMQQENEDSFKTPTILSTKDLISLKLEEGGNGAEDEEDTLFTANNEPEEEAEELDSPSDYIISQEAVILEDGFNEPLGPGRIRKFASQDPTTDSWKSHLSHFFIFSLAGKPIYSRYGDESKLTSLTGFLQTIISLFEDSDDLIKSVEFCDEGEEVEVMKICFLVKKSLCFVLVRRKNKNFCHGLSDSVMREELNWLYNQIISITTATQLNRIFSRNEGFDLRRLLGGCEVFLDHLCDTVTNPGAIHALKLNQSIRHSVGSALQQSLKGFNVKESGLLYGMLSVEDKLVTILRPKRYSFHPSDLHLLFNMVNSSSSFQSVPESWMPICLPKFNSITYLHAYISYITPSYPHPANKLLLTLISTNPSSFHLISELRKKIVDEMVKSGSLFLVQEGIRKSEFFVSDVGTALGLGGSLGGLRWFLYKDKGSIQYCCPGFDGVYKTRKIDKEDDDTGNDNQKRLYGVIRHIRSVLYKNYMKNGKGMLFEVSEYESVYAMNEKGFELYAVFGPLVTKANATSGVNLLLKWIKKEEDSLFIGNAPTF